MKFKQFKHLLELHKKTFSDFSELNDIGFDFYENKKFPLVENVDNIINNLLSSILTEHGLDWFMWFVYENDYGNKPCSDKLLPNGYNAFDDTSGKKEYICYDVKSLYVYLKSNKYFI